MFEPTGLEVVFLLSRLLFGGVIVFTGVNHFLDLEAMAGYAEYKGLPAPRLSVLGSGVVLVAGGLSIVLGVFPLVGGLAVAAFLLVAGITMHDFWAVSDEEAQNELTHFLKNVYGAGGALAFAAVASGPWPYAVNVGLF